MVVDGLSRVNCPRTFSCQCDSELTVSSPKGQSNFSDLAARSLISYVKWWGVI